MLRLDDGPEVHAAYKNSKLRRDIKYEATWRYKDEPTNMRSFLGARSFGNKNTNLRMWKLEAEVIKIWSLRYKNIKLKIWEYET